MALFGQDEWMENIWCSLVHDLEFIPSYHYIWKDRRYRCWCKASKPGEDLHPELRGDPESWTG